MHQQIRQASEHDQSSFMLFDDCTIEPEYNLTLVEGKKAKLAKLSNNVNRQNGIS